MLGTPGYRDTCLSADMGVNAADHLIQGLVKHWMLRRLAL